jgi:hypothetical protein
MDDALRGTYTFVEVYEPDGRDEFDDRRDEEGEREHGTIARFAGEDSYPFRESLARVEDDDEPAGFENWLARLAGSDAFPTHAHRASMICLSLIVQRAAANEENLAALARVAIGRATVDGRTKLAESPDDERDEAICTADELVRLCYWARDTQAPHASTLREDDWMGTIALDVGMLHALPYRRWDVCEVRVRDKQEQEYTCWTADELAAAVAEWRACARRPTVDAAEAPPRDSEI